MILKEHEFRGGIRRVYKFENGYGASIVRHKFSYGGDQGLWELAVLKFDGEDDEEGRITYLTPITNDVLGYLTWPQVECLLERIKELNREKDELKIRFEFIPEESYDGYNGDHLKIYQIFAPKEVDDQMIILAFLESDIYPFRYPYGDFRVEKDENGAPHKLHWRYDTSD